MGFNHIKYDLKEFHNQIISTCSIFTNENLGYLPIYHLLDKDIREDTKLQLIEPIKQIYGKEAFEY